MNKNLLFTLWLAATASVLGQDAADKLGWQLSVHAYSFRKFTIYEAIDKTAGLGLKYMSLSGSINLEPDKSVKTVEISDAELESIQKKAAAAGIKLVNIGVVQLPPDEAKSRKVFEFAKKAGIDTLVAEPVPEALDTVEKLCKEYNIKVAIHNHPKPSPYWDPDTVLEALKGRTPLMGACADTGHWMRSSLDPVACLKKLEGRIICLHFKDLVVEEPSEQEKEATAKRTKQPAKVPGLKKMHDVPWGTGVGNAKGMLAELKRQKFRGVFGIEYEYNWDNSVPEIAQCVKFFNDFVKSDP